MSLDYHQLSKSSLQSALSGPSQRGVQPPLYKDCGIAERMSLPRDYTRGGMAFEEVVRRRRSVREYSPRPLTLDQLSGLLDLSYGITEPSRERRASASAGAQYPLEIYPVVADVEGLVRGVYHYHPRDHSMDMIKGGDFRSSLLTDTGGQDMVLGAGVVLVITAIFQRTRRKYKDRAYRYVLLDAGHLGQSLNLAATALGLGACVMGAFLDDQVNRLVQVDGEDEAALFLVSVGTT